MAIVGTTTAMIQGVTITADGESPNTDGIHVESSSAVNITHSNVGTGDDCVSIGPRTNGVTIRNLTCGPGHGVSIGSLGREDNEGRVENILVEYVQFTETQNGARIKAVARPEADAVVNQVVFQHLTMTDVTNPVLIDQYYCPDHQNCPQGDSGVKIGNVKFVDIRGSSKSEFAVNLNCSALSKCSDITVSDVELTYNGGKPRASCNNLLGNPCDSVFPSN
ncbi:unnamed protein product [Cuscuta epithymum]|uniref:Polygalacturonase n=1 Tax=Cuscuta epithymum TaxID=186058 RepID=A0AAV0EA66_9ASTE|nr:unnamed protein product [Cuscuta epithymum]